MTTTELHSASTEKFFKLPRGAQLMVAYALVNDQWDLQLLRNDPDGLALREAGWLQEKQAKIKGFGVFEFSDDAWEKMQSIREQVLGSITEDELDNFKSRKSKAYPWLW